MVFGTRGTVIKNKDLSQVTWLRVGGPADLFFMPADIEDLIKFLKMLPNKFDIIPIGVGSNLIIRDGGIRGAVIRLGSGFKNISFENNKIVVGASALDAHVASKAADNGLDLTFLRTIPGSIGGAIKMNAGCYGNEISDVVIHKNKIFSISKDFQTEALKQDNQIDIYDCDGLTMTPGIIDMRVNIGKTENLVSTQKIAAENGITSMVILPNQTPKLNNPSIIDHIKRQSENSKLPKVNVYGAATKDDQGLEMSEIGLMSEMGAIGFTNGNKSIKNSLVI